jgi:hypothetical protein
LPKLWSTVRHLEKKVHALVQPVDKQS